MAKSRRQNAPRDRKHPFKVPRGPCEPKPPKHPGPPKPNKPGDVVWPDPLKWLKIGKK